MNILMASTLDLIDHLRELTKGWRIDPLVLCKDERLTHHGLTAVQTPPRGQSFTDYFAAESVNEQYALIRLKIPHHTLRLIQCSLTNDTQLVLRYWRANGFRQNQSSCGYGWRARKRIFDYDTQLVYHTFAIERITKGTKSKGKKRRGRPNIIHRDRIEVGVPSSATRAALLAKETIEKSLDRRYDDLRTRFTRLAVVLDGENFTYTATYEISSRIV
jgi:hypothetical protein